MYGTRLIRFPKEERERRMSIMTKPKPSAADRAARSKLLRRLAGAKRIEAMLKPEAAKALATLRKRTGHPHSVIIEAALIAASKR
jgi:hypothetical protein